MPFFGPVVNKYVIVLLSCLLNLFKGYRSEVRQIPRVC